MLFAPWRHRSHRIRGCIPAATQQRDRCPHSLQQQYYLPEICCLDWSCKQNRAIIWESRAFRLRAEKRKLSVHLLHGRTDLSQPPPAFNLVAGWDSCQPAVWEWQGGCVTQHCPTCICFTSESVLLHLNGSQVSSFSSKNRVFSLYLHLKTENWHSFKNIFAYDSKIAETFPLTEDELFSQSEQTLVIQENINGKIFVNMTLR